MQKTGGGLFIHNWLHSQAAIVYSSDHHQEIEKNSFGCTCADDFYLPFEEASGQVETIPPTPKNEFPGSYSYTIPFGIKFFRSLRAPPACLT